MWYVGCRGDSAHTVCQIELVLISGRLGLTLGGADIILRYYGNKSYGSYGMVVIIIKKS